MILQRFHRLFLLSSLMATFGVPRLVAAQESKPGPVSCAAEESALAEARDEITSLRARLAEEKQHGADATALKADLERKIAEFERETGARAQCESREQRLCEGVSILASGIAEGQLTTDGVAECLGPNTRAALGAQLGGVNSASAVLAQLGAYSAGETDLFPRAGALRGSRLERLVARLFASGQASPLAFRRLLVETVEMIAPESWARVRRKPADVDRWFSSGPALEPEIVEEAQRGFDKAKTSGNSLSSALTLVLAYERLARCSEPGAPRDCARAEALRGLLESSGPLVARRRVQDIWASECSTLTPARVTEWLARFPGRGGASEDQALIVDATESKLFSCFLRAPDAGSSFRTFLTSKLPASDREAPLSTLLLERERTSRSPEVSACVAAARELQNLKAPSECSIGPWLGPVERWATAMTTRSAEVSFAATVCDKYAAALWRGEPAQLEDSYDVPPPASETVHLSKDGTKTNVLGLRSLCDERVGSSSTFEEAVVRLANVGASLGENPALSPWRLADKGTSPRETVLAERADRTPAFLQSLVRPKLACALLDMDEKRCLGCSASADQTRYDCAALARLEDSYARRTRLLVFGALAFVALVLAIRWGASLRRALRRHGAWLTQVRSHLQSLGFTLEKNPWSWVFPSRLGELHVELPSEPIWERWGSHAVLLPSDGFRISDRDVQQAAVSAARSGAQLSILVHGETASPDLGAVRAMLDWAARPGTKAVHVLPLSNARLRWAQKSGDLLELVEETAVRENPFEVRGRVTRSSQFFGRERLVSGLLASAQAGHFSVVTGLRRFGKSSLTLEVARRLPGPSAFVDLAGFHHEIRTESPARVVDGILRFLLDRLVESARLRKPEFVPPEVTDTDLDTAALARWFRSFAERLSAAEHGRTPPVLLIFDELEQAIGSASDLGRALEVLATLVGRLRNSLAGIEEVARARVGILYSSAIHPLLWAPLGTLAHQSLMGTYSHVAVPCLPADAAKTMMRELGARQGIRFQEEALDLLVRESQGIPLLVRRLGSTVLELYDPERARQGGLGAVDVGIEAVVAAVEREVLEGSPVRVWVESEIAEARSPGGEMLRTLAKRGPIPATELRRVGAQAFIAQFAEKGVSLALDDAEATRRAEEAASVTLRALGDSGLLVTHGDPTEPDAYELGAGLLRRVLGAN